MLIRLDSSQCVPLTEQIVKGIGRLVDDRALLPGARLPSIRQFAAAHDVSNFTVVQAYDQLIVSGYIESRRGAGFFVNKPLRPAEPTEAGPLHERARDALWLMRKQSGQNCFKHRPGSGWLPHMWLAEGGLERALRELARRGADAFDSGHGDLLGYAPLRAHVSRRLAEHGIQACPNQVLMTNGVTGGLDLVARYLIRPDDVVLVDDPGYYQWFGHMRALGATVHGVPWNDTGPDLERLETLARSHQPRLYITTPIVQNPTGRSICPGTAFRLLQLAERYDFYIVEDGADSLCNPAAPLRLAGLDQLNRVVYLSSFSKTLSPRLRVGMLAGHKDLVQDLADLKLLTQSSSSGVYRAAGLRGHRPGALPEVSRQAPRQNSESAHRGSPPSGSHRFRSGCGPHARAVRVAGRSRGCRHDRPGGGRAQAQNAARARRPVPAQHGKVDQDALQRRVLPERRAVSRTRGLAECRISPVSPVTLI